jgi:hypothetical protein
MRFGQAVRDLIPTEVFKKAVPVIVPLSGIGLIVKALVPH